MTDSEFLQKITEIESPMYDLDYTHTFKKSVKSSFKSKKDLNLLLKVVVQLVQTGSLEKSYNPHQLSGFPQKNDRKIMECHIQPDWLLVWVQENSALTLMLFDTGTHSELFNSKKLRKGNLR
jgi:mRNA interferase YafQ